MTTTRSDWPYNIPWYRSDAVEPAAATGVAATIPVVPMASLIPSISYRFSATVLARNPASGALVDRAAFEIEGIFDSDANGNPTNLVLVTAPVLILLKSAGAAAWTCTASIAADALNVDCAGAVAATRWTVNAVVERVNP